VRVLQEFQIVVFDKLLVRNKIGENIASSIVILLLSRGVAVNIYLRNFSRLLQQLRGLGEQQPELRITFPSFVLMFLS
jgi:hypothetical protein